MLDPQEIAALALTRHHELPALPILPTPIPDTFPQLPTGLPSVLPAINGQAVFGDTQEALESPKPISSSYEMARLAGNDLNQDSLDAVDPFSSFGEIGDTSQDSFDPLNVDIAFESELGSIV